MSTPCPSCTQPLTGATACGACGISVSGPVAARLWTVDQRMATLQAELGALRPERDQLLTLLRTEEPLPAWTPPPPREANPAQVQNTLLSLGALLLVGAGVVFAAVTYNALGAGGRALVLLALTTLAAFGAAVLVKRGLTASGEAVSSVALVLTAVDASALRRAGVGTGIDGQTYAAIASGLLAILAAGWAALLPLRSSRCAAVILAQGPVVLCLAHGHASPSTVAIGLSLLSAANVLAWFVPQLPTEVRGVARAFSGLWSIATLIAVADAVHDHERYGALGLIVLAGVATGLALTASGQARALSAGLVPVLLGAAAYGLTEQDVSRTQQPLIAVAVALLALQASALLRPTDRVGPVLGGLAIAVTALVAELPSVGEAGAGPFSWLGHPWTLHAAQARDALAVQGRWDGSVVTLVVLAATAACAITAGLVLDRLELAAVPAGVLLVLSALVLPLGLATSYDVALAVMLLVSAALAGTGVLLMSRQRGIGLALVATGTAASLVAAVWSTADQDATLVVLPVAALLAAVLALRVPGVLTGLALLLGGAELAAYGVSRGLAQDQVGGLLLAAPLVAVALSFAVPRLHRWGAEGAAVLLATASAVVASEGPGWLSWSLAGNGLLCLVVAARQDRRAVDVVGGLLLASSSWVRLADAHVSAPEPYVLPLAAAALIAGALRRRARPDIASFEAYGAGLALALLPSLLKSLSDTSPTRGLVLLVVAAGVVLAGVPERLRAALTIGGGVLVIDALHLLAPYASALPRWALLAAAGAVLVGVGATYEQRLKDVTRLRESFETWS